MLAGNKNANTKEASSFVNGFGSTTSEIWNETTNDHL
jgi:hypothetical protein